MGVLQGEPVTKSKQLISPDICRSPLYAKRKRKSTSLPGFNTDFLRTYPFFQVFFWQLLSRVNKAEFTVSYKVKKKKMILPVSFQGPGRDSVGSADNHKLAQGSETRKEQSLVQK